MKGTYLGEFEELVLLTTGVLYDEAYGVAIKKEIQGQTGRKVTLSAVHSALHRLEDKGFLKSRLGGATKERGGKSKRFFAITAYGKKSLEEARGMRDSLWSQIPKIALDI